MKIEIYTKANCPNCMTAKALLKAKGLEYAEYNIDDPVYLESFKTLHPELRQMPQIFINNRRVGGLAGLQAALKQVGL
jgi:glutaredoxin 3